jgi:cyclohexanone monooxygenase
VAEDEWVALIDSHLGTIFGDTECTPGYYNGEGREATIRDRRNSSGHPLGAVAYFEYIDGWRTSGDFVGLEFRT